MKRTPLLAALAAPLLAVPALATSQEAADPGGLFVVRIAHDGATHDGAAHRAALAELGALRAAGHGDAFRLRQAEVEAAAEAAVAPLRDAALALELEVVDELWLAPGLVVRGAGAALEALAAHPLANGASAAGVRGPADAQANAAHGLADLHATPYAATTLEGGGVTIAILDSGIDLETGATGRPHAAFYADGDPSDLSGGGVQGSRIVSAEGVSTVIGAPVGTDDPEDEFGHGTRMASFAAGAKWNALPAVTDGAAPSASIRSYRITDDAQPSLASTYTMEKAFELAVAQPDVRVANLSYGGHPGPGYHLNEAIDSAVLAGVVVTVSAGNSGTSLDFAHGAYSALPVGSSFEAAPEPYVFPGFQTSAVGPLPDGRRYPLLLAIGEQLTGAQLDDESASVDSWGTSGAAATTAGAAAILLQAAPTLSPDAVRALLLHTADPVALGDPAAAGFGFLRADLAVDAALAGEVATGVALLGVAPTWTFAGDAGEEVAFTLAWNREDPAVPFAEDLDLELSTASGTLLAQSVLALDTAEQVVATLPAAGAYEVRVRARAVDADGAVSFALAGASGAPSYESYACPAGTPAIDLVTPDSVPATGPQARVWVKGCGLDQVTSATVAGIPAALLPEGPERVSVVLPPGVPTGVQPLVLGTPGGPLNATVGVDLAGPQLAVSPNVWSGTSVWFDFQGQPGQPFAVLTSTLLGPTPLPGLVDLDIGTAGAELVLLHVATAGPGGAWSKTTPVPAGLLTGTTFFFQAAAVELPSLSLVTSNVAQTLVIDHVF